MRHETRDHVVARVKLARTLGRRPDEMGAVADVPAEDLEAFRHQVADALFAAERARFARIAGLAKAVPGPVAAKIAEAAVPAQLAARAANALEPDRAIGLVGRLSDAYLADVSCVLDVDRVHELIALIDADKIAQVAAVLAERGEWVVIGQFVDHVSGDGVRASVRRLGGEQLLRSGYYVDDAGRLDLIGELVGDEQLDDMIRATAEHGLWQQASWLAANLGPEQLGRLAARFAAADESTREAFAQAAAAGELGDDDLARLVPR